MSHCSVVKEEESLKAYYKLSRVGIGEYDNTISLPLSICEKRNILWYDMAHKFEIIWFLSMGLLKSSEYTFTNYHIMSCGFIMLYVKRMFQIVVSLHCFSTLQVLWLIVKAEMEEKIIVLKSLMGFWEWSLTFYLAVIKTVSDWKLWGWIQIISTLSGICLYFIGLDSKG